MLHHTFYEEVSYADGLRLNKRAAPAGVIAITLTQVCAVTKIFCQHALWRDMPTELFEGDWARTANLAP
jgi:hypothetical protein